MKHIVLNCVYSLNADWRYMWQRGARCLDVVTEYFTQVNTPKGLSVLFTVCSQRHLFFSLLIQKGGLLFRAVCNVISLWMLTGKTPGKCSCTNHSQWCCFILTRDVVMNLSICVSREHDTLEMKKKACKSFTFMTFLFIHCNILSQRYHIHSLTLSTWWVKLFHPSNSIRISGAGWWGAAGL